VEFPDISVEKEKLIDTFSREKNITPADVRVIASPYRICPLGAHIDHQGGSVLGMTINACTLMAFCSSADSTIRLTSRNYPGEVHFDLQNITDSTGSFWGVYPRAAALALLEKHALSRGVVGMLDGMLPGCGLSSSASVLLAYLHAFAAANIIELEPWEYVHLTHRAEREFIGLNNGILDQTSIVFGQQDSLLHIDTKNNIITRLPDHLSAAEYRILVAFSGYSRELTTSGYNSRVDECRQAAGNLSRMAEKNLAARLSDVAYEDYLRFKDDLDRVQTMRSGHFFTESQRVSDGVSAWEQMNLQRFGQLMNESCKSSIEQYECGIQAICDLQQIVSSAEGVFGSRFMGGGFGGCVVGFVKTGNARTAVADIQTTYRKLHPEVDEQSAFYLARSDDGVRFI